MPDPQPLVLPRGHVIMTTWGMVRHEAMNSWTEMRSFSEAQGLKNAFWGTIPGALVEKARNEAVRQMLRDPEAKWLLQIDGDMSWQPDAALRLLATAYGEMPYVDAIGGYCCLRGELGLPTIDTGTGTWESHFPGSGVLEVMRTGAAFLLVKRHVFEALRDPWFRVRVPSRPIDFMHEVDNYARIKFDGTNPFAGKPGREWERLMRCAEDDPSIGGDFTPSEVGEDSGFSDRLRAAGFRLFVHTDVVTGHIDVKVTGWQSHKEAMENMEKQGRLIAGILE